MSVAFARMPLRLSLARRGRPYNWRPHAGDEGRKRPIGASVDCEDAGVAWVEWGCEVSEATLYTELSLEATRRQHRLWRNQVGTALYRDRHGKEWRVPYGIPGPGGADMLGYTLQLITLTDVGKTLPVITAVECKMQGKKARDNQQDFLDAIARAGGISGVCRSVEDYRRLVGAE